MSSPVYIDHDIEWGSPEEEKLYQKALQEYNDAVNSGKHDYVCLIQSFHWASHGYWVEFKKSDIKPPDLLLKEAK